ncbi:DNA recombination protein RmuC [Pseudomonadota bacterium]
MEQILPLVYLLLGTVIGAGCMWLWQKSKKTAVSTTSDVSQKAVAIEASLNAQLNAKAEQLAKLETELQQLKTDFQEQQHGNTEHSNTIARLETQLVEERKQSSGKLKVLDEAKAQLAEQFQNLANKILDEKSKKFTDQNKINLDQVLNPLREQLGDFRRKVEDVYEKESKDRMSLFHEINNLKSLNQQISVDAINLTNALKGTNKTQGNWGEVILERVLEESGLHKGREYETQGSFTNEEGKRLRPDVIVHLPEGKNIVIDSKVTLTAYERYCTVEDDAERQKALNEHVLSLRSHLKGLSVKRYEELPGITSLDFVLMFVPVEAAFITAVENDQTIFREAFDKNIIVVSPTTLLATLRTVHNIWRYEYQNRNTIEIADRAGRLYDQFVLFSESLLDVGDKLGKAQSAYETTMKRLTDGKGNLVSRTEQLKTLGAKAKKKIPQVLADKATVDASDESELAEALPPVNSPVKDKAAPGVEGVKV